MSLTGPAAVYLPTLKKLYDIENNRACRAVRERITELDLTIENVIPAAENSRVMAFSTKPKVVPTLVAEVDGEEVVLAGERKIVEFLDLKFTTNKDKDNSQSEEEVADPPEVIVDLLLKIGSYLPAILRSGRGTKVVSAAYDLTAPRPVQTLVLYSYEGNQFCRLVREVLTELDLTYELRSAGKGSPRRDELASITGGSTQCPYLIDPNTGMSMSESKDIIEYLYKTYALWTPPNQLLGELSDLASLLKPVYKVLAPLQAGSSKENEFEYKRDVADAKAKIYDEILSKPVVVYTYELSPFCFEATSLLASLGIRFKEVSLGQEWIPGLIKEPIKRAALLEITGQSSLPHIFIGGTSIGGLFSGTPGLVPALETGELMELVAEAQQQPTVSDAKLMEFE